MAAIKIKLVERERCKLVISFRRRSNAIITINVNGIQVEGMDNVRGVMFNHFENHFQLCLLALGG